MDSAPSKEVAWSYSKLHDFEICPRRFNEKGNWETGARSEQLQWGDAAHAALAKALKTSTPLPPVFQLYQDWVDKVVRTPGEMMVEDECRWAITRTFEPTPWFAKNVWLRCVADVVKLDPPAALIVDWKAGKSSNADPLQLVLTSLILLIHYPQIHGVRSDFIWLQEGTQTKQMIRRDEAPDHWAELIPRVTRFQNAMQSGNFPPTPNRFCRSWCPVRSCEYHGK